MRLDLLQVSDCAQPVEPKLCSGAASVSDGSTVDSCNREEGRLRIDAPVHFISRDK